MTVAPGTRLGPYEILASLGAGGMGEVYRALDTRLGRGVAVKVLPDAVARDPDRLARFEREARTVAGLNHPNIVVLHSIEEDAGVRFITMELVDGESLDRYVVPKGLPLSRLLELFPERRLRFGCFPPRMREPPDCCAEQEQERPDPPR